MRTPHPHLEPCSLVGMLTEPRAMDSGWCPDRRHFPPAIEAHVGATRQSRAMRSRAPRNLPRAPEPVATPNEHVDRTMSQKLPPQAQRWRTIIFTVPIIGVTSCMCTYSHLLAQTLTTEDSCLV